jgi:hypothetical protein
LCGTIGSNVDRRKIDGRCNQKANTQCALQICLRISRKSTDNEWLCVLNLSRISRENVRK